MIKRLTSNVFAVFVILIVMSMIIPLNNIFNGALLDFLLILNISLRLLFF